MGRFREFLSGEAFRPHPLDINAPLRVRLAGRRFMFAKRGQARWVLRVLELSPDGKTVALLNEDSMSRVEKGDQVARFRHYGKEHGVEFVVICTSSQVKFTERVLEELPETVLEMQTLLQDDPRTLLQGAYQEDARSFPIPHPYLDSTYLFQIPIRVVEEIVGEMHQAGLGVSRIQSTIACGLNYLLTRNPEFLQKEDFYMLLHDEECFFGCMIRDGALSQPVWRSSEKFGSFSTALQSLESEVNQRRPRGLLVANMSGEPDMITKIKQGVTLPSQFEILNLFEGIEFPDQEVILNG